MTDLEKYFLQPSNATHRKYEALRAVIVDKESAKDAAEKFGYSHGSLRNLLSAFRKDPAQTFFAPDGRAGSRKKAGPPDRDERILALRKKHNLSAKDIVKALSKDNISISVSSVIRILKKAGVPKLKRRTRTELVAPLEAPVADHRELNLANQRFRTEFGGLFLFAHNLVKLDVDDVARGLPGSCMIPAGCALRSLLALKLWGTGRPSHITSDVLDKGLGLFAGLNVCPKRSTLTEWSMRVDPRETDKIMARWHEAVRNIDVELGQGSSFDLDFHTIPYHGDDALVEKHYVSKRSRRQKGILAFLARDDKARVFCYANANVRKENQNDEILRFIAWWEKNNGKLPDELIFDSRLTTHATLGKLDKMGIGFITLRRRTKNMLEDLNALPPESWRRVRLNNVGRKYRTPRIYEEQIKLKSYNDTIRQVAIDDLGHEKPTLLLTNQKKTPATTLIDRYARRMVIENTIADAIDLFHMDALSAAIPLRINLDLQLTLMASALYRILACRLGTEFEKAEPRTLFRKFVKASANVVITPDEITVTFGRRTNNSYLIRAGYDQETLHIPWLNNRPLRIKFR